MLPFKENLELTDFPIKFFVSRSTKNASIVALPHWHNAIEILYVAEGTANQQLGDHIFRIEKGDIVVIWGNQYHSTYSIADEYCEIVVLQISYVIFINPILSSETNTLKNLHFYNKIKSASKIGTILLDYINMITRELEHKKEGYRFLLYSATYSLIGTIIRNRTSLPISDNKKCSEKDRLLGIRIFNYIENNFNDDITLNKIASEVGLSITHFSRVFKNVSGMTFKQYLNYYKINKSISFLENGESITEAAIKSGFGDINTFIRNFKKYKGTVPSKYKR